MNMNVWVRQALTVMRVELQRNILARRWLGLYLAAFAPVFMLTIAAIRLRGGPRLSGLTTGYAVFYQTFELRLAIFFCCALVFSQLVRGEMVEKTLHFYMLSPVRREVLMFGKYLAGVAGTSVIFGLTTVLTHILVYMQSREWQTFFLEGDGIPNTIRYLSVTVLACMTYGAIFLLAGLLFKNPSVSAVVLAGWEAFFFVLPATLQRFTVMHYLQSILPVGIDMGPFAVVVDRTPAVWGIPILVAAAAATVWICGQVMRRMQITYGAD